MLWYYERFIRIFKVILFVDEIRKLFSICNVHLKKSNLSGIDTEFNYSNIEFMIMGCRTILKIKWILCLCYVIINILCSAVLKMNIYIFNVDSYSKRVSKILWKYTAIEIS